MKTLLISNTASFVAGVIVARLYWSEVIAAGKAKLLQLEMKFGFTKTPPAPPA